MTAFYRILNGSDQSSLYYQTYGVYRSGKLSIIQHQLTLKVIIGVHVAMSLEINTTPLNDNIGIKLLVSS